MAFVSPSLAVTATARAQHTTAIATRRASLRYSAASCSFSRGSSRTMSWLFGKKDGGDSSATATTTPTAKLETGTPAPDFSAKDQDGNTVSLSDFKGKSNLVVFFYPKAFTPGCTKQACTFRDSMERLSALDAKVVGISSDTVEDQDRFGKQYNLAYPLLADEGGKIRAAFQVPSTFGILAGRVTYVIDKEGIIREIFNSQLNVTEHVAVAERALKEITASAK